MKPKTRGTFLRDFWLRVHKIPGGCWQWMGGKTEAGYGTVSWLGKKMYCHRLSLSFVCEVPDSLKVLHSCDNRGCVNPEHLFLGTDLDNMLDKVSKGRDRNSDGIHYASKLNASQIEEVKDAIKNGEYQRNIAYRYGVSQGTISNINRGFTHAHQRLTK